MAGKPKLTPARAKQLAAKPGTRAALPDSALSPTQLAQRHLNARLNQPVVPGSTMTNRDLARMTQTAAQEKYGPQLAQAQQNVTAAKQVQQDTGSFYDAYLKDLAAHQANVKAIQQQALTGAQELSQAAGGIGSGVVNPTQQNQTDASNAASVRKTLVDALVGTQQLTGAAQNTAADSLTNVVGPAAKLAALKNAQGGVGKAGQDLASVLGQQGAFRTSLDQQARADEGKNQLAITLATGKQQAASADKAAGLKASTHKWSSTVNKYGVTNGAWADYGKTASGRAKRQKIIDDYNKVVHPPKTPKQPKAPSQPAQAKATSQIGSAVHYIKAFLHQGESPAQIRAALLTGIPASGGDVIYDNNHKPQLNPDGTRKTTERTAAVPKVEPLYLDAALDIATKGYISPTHLSRLKAAGVDVAKIGYAPPKTKQQKQAAGVLAAGGTVVDAAKGVLGQLGGG